MNETEFVTYEVLPGREGTHGPQKVDWVGVTEFARTHPDVWVEVPEILSPSVAYQIRSGIYTSVPPDEFEVTTRRVDSPGPRRAHLYIRARS